jgi:DNA polymerase-3 subunit alpha
LLASVDLAWEFAQSQANNVHQVGLFESEHGAHSEEPPMNNAPIWTVRERLTNEKSAIGFHLSGHLFEEYSLEVKQFIKIPLSDLTESKEPQWVAGIVKNERFINTARGKLYIFELDDMSSVVEITVDETVFNANRKYLEEDQLMIAQLRVQADRRDPSQLRLTLIQAKNLFEARCQFGKFLQFQLNHESVAIDELLQSQPSELISEKTSQHFSDKFSGLGVKVFFQLNHYQAEFALGENVKFIPSDDSMAKLGTGIFKDKAFISYD